jgi:biotin carboxyl carrier protein
MAPIVLVALVTTSLFVVTDALNGAYLVEHDGRLEVVFVAGGADDPWAFWNGYVFHGVEGNDRSPLRGRQEVASLHHHARGATQTLAAPMPATVVKVLVQPGAEVKSGDALIVLEAMKMELPLRAPADATVKAVHCREGELVSPETILVELE